VTDSDRSLRSLWDLWRMLWRLRDGVESGETLVPPDEDDSDFPDTRPYMRPDPE
jgi:hypothetical protein